MKFHNPSARVFVPDQAPEPFGRITHMRIGAHQDDLEFMAVHGLLACFHSKEKDREKVVRNVGGHEHLAAAVSGVFDSQIAGGKRYDLPTLGRRRANATFFESHAVDECESASYAMDLAPLVADPSLDVAEYVLGFIRRFEDDVRSKLTKRLS